MNKEIMNEIDDKLLFHYELNYVNNLKQQLKKANEEIKKIRKGGIQARLFEVNEKLEKIEQWCYKHGQEINATDILEIIKGSDNK